MIINSVFPRNYSLLKVESVEIFIYFPHYGNFLFHKLNSCLRNYWRGKLFKGGNYLWKYGNLCICICFSLYVSMQEVRTYLNTIQMTLTLRNNPFTMDPHFCLIIWKNKHFTLSYYFFLMLPEHPILVVPGLPTHGQLLLTKMSGSHPTQEPWILALVFSQPRWLGHTSL